jgi:hypothetical protein
MADEITSPYQSPGLAEEQPSWLGFPMRIALQGALPLLCGIAVYVGWIATHASWLPITGVAVIFGGLFVFICGAVEILWRAMQGSASTIPLGSLRIAAVGLAGLFLLNGVVALAIIGRVVAEETAYSVVIVNHSPAMISGLTLTGPGVKHNLRDLPPGGEIQEEMHFSGEGAVVLSGRRLGEPFSITVSGYVTSNVPGQATVEFGANDQITQRESRDSRILE